MSRNGILTGLIVVAAVATLARSPRLNPDSICSAYNRLLGFELCTQSTDHPEHVSGNEGVIADPEIAKAAIYSLAGSLTEESVGELMLFARSDNDCDVRKAAIYAIASIGGDESHAILMELAHDPTTEIAKAAIHALAGQLDEADVMQLEILLNEIDRSEVKKTLVYQIAHTGGSNAAAILARVVETESNPGLRKAAVYALGQLDTAEARSYLVRLANHSG